MMNFMSVISSLAPHSAASLASGTGRGSGLVGGLSGLGGTSRSDRSAASAAQNSRDSYISKESWENQLAGASPLSRDELDCCVMQYLLLSGYQETAEKLAEECGATTSEEHDMLPHQKLMAKELHNSCASGGSATGLANRVKLRDLVTSGEIAEAIQLTQRLYPELLESHFMEEFSGDKIYPGQLYFHMRQQQLIELIRDGKVEAALEFAQSQMTELLMDSSDVSDSESAGFKANPSRLAEMERTMALLAFEEPEKSSFGALMSQKHREKIANELNRAILLAEDVAHPDSRLEMMLKVLLWGQDELQKRHIHCPKMVDLSSATLGMPSTQHSLDEGR